MTETNPFEDWSWTPKSHEDSLLWKQASSDNGYRIYPKIAASPFTSVETLRDMADSKLNVRQGRGRGDYAYAETYSAMLDNPNMTPELLAYLDEKSATWSPETNWVYWLKRFEPETSEPDDSTDDYFDENLINRNDLSIEEAAGSILNLSSGLAQQFWHDLSIAKRISLTYQRDNYDGDLFEPFIEGDTTGERIYELLSPGYDATWIDHEESLDQEYARDRLNDEYSELIDEGEWMTWGDGEPFHEVLLAAAIGAGLDKNDLIVKDEPQFTRYLEVLYEDDEQMLESSVTITSDTPWQGPRFSELSENQRFNLTHNLVTSMTHPALSSGISEHLLLCIAAHPMTEEKTLTYLFLQDSAAIKAGLALRKIEAN
ncbi:MAG: hypothetical protein RL228_1143 [Actinomycetota bacterium]